MPAARSCWYCGGRGPIRADCRTEYPDAVAMWSPVTLASNPSAAAHLHCGSHSHHSSATVESTFSPLRKFSMETIVSVLLVRNYYIRICTYKSQVLLRYTVRTVLNCIAGIHFRMLTHGTECNFLTMCTVVRVCRLAGEGAYVYSVRVHVNAYCSLTCDAHCDDATLRLPRCWPATTPGGGRVSTSKECGARGIIICGDLWPVWRHSGQRTLLCSYTSCSGGVLGDS
jgi:hypothetical protein